jgi:hypothetical protein
LLVGKSPGIFVVPGGFLVEVAPGVWDVESKENEVECLAKKNRYLYGENLTSIHQMRLQSTYSHSPGHSILEITLPVLSGICNPLRNLETIPLSIHIFLFNMICF